MSEINVKQLTCDRCHVTKTVDMNTYGGQCLWLDVKVNFVRISFHLSDKISMNHHLCVSCADDHKLFMSEILEPSDDPTMTAIGPDGDD